MKYLELDREKSKNIFEAIQSKKIDVFNNDYYQSLDNSYLKIRETILSWLKEKPITKSYEFDLYLAIKLHKYFSKQNFEGFNESIASNYDFWRYLCLKVVPDIIIERHGVVKEYFYAKNVRLYLSTLWWYIEMGYQGDYETTSNCLMNLSTDYIQGIVERPGRDGIYIDVSRYIVYYLSQLPTDVVNKKINNRILLRRIAIQNTARSANYNLVLDGKTKQYVIELFRVCGVEVNKYGIN